MVKLAFRPFHEMSSALCYCCPSIDDMAIALVLIFGLARADPVFFIPGDNCGLSHEIETVESLPDDLDTLHCVFLKNKEDFQVYQMAMKKAKGKL